MTKYKLGELIELVEETNSEDPSSILSDFRRV